jgi:hypothetical protein
VQDAVAGVERLTVVDPAHPVEGQVEVGALGDSLMLGPLS